MVGERERCRRMAPATGCIMRDSAVPFVSNPLAGYIVGGGARCRLISLPHLCLALFQATWQQ